MKINLQELRERLTDEQVIALMVSLGADHYEERVDAILFPTICHNPRGRDASLKLYYYRNSHMFHCYTECGENFDIFDLLVKVHQINDEEFNFYDGVYQIADLVAYDFFSETSSSSYISNTDKFNDKTQEINLLEYDKTVLELFRWCPSAEWLAEGISETAMKRFNIGYYDYRHKITIPHYDIDGRLIGIRGRALDPIEAELYGKYTPLKVEDIMYKHPLSFNLYGIYENQEDIRKYKTAVIFERRKISIKIWRFI